MIASLAGAYGRYAGVVGNATEAQIAKASDPSLTGLALALTLFLLAGVFRKGSAMREDLEGTV